MANFNECNFLIDRLRGYLIELLALTGLPVVLENEAVRAEAEYPTHRGQTRVRASRVIDAAGTRVLACMVVDGQRGVLQTPAGAFVASYEISTGVLARTVSVVQ